VGPGKFPGSTERPVSSTVIEKRKGIDFGPCRQTQFARLLVRKFDKQKEEVYGNEFDRNFQRCGGIKLWAGCGVVLGRFFFALIFLLAGANHFNKQTIGYAASQGVPLASIAVPLSGAVAIAGGLSILLGYRAKLGAWLIVLFLIPVSLMMHKFWTVTDPMMAQLQMVMFMKNVSMLGGALLVSQFGAGPFSLDARRSR
jgi:putative oxidoreductase